MFNKSLILKMSTDFCPICLEHDEKEGNCVMCSSCGHFICGYCVTQSHKNNIESCPQCREPYFESDERYISNLLFLIEKNSPRTRLFALANLGSHYYSMNEYRMARKYLTEPSQNGFKGAANKLGKLCLHGLGGKKDFKLAKDLFMSSMEIPSSVYSLGIMYQKGQGVKKNYGYGIVLKRIGKNIIGSDSIFHCKTGKTIFI